MRESRGLGRPEGSRRCKAAGEMASGGAGAGYGEYRTLGPNGPGCPMCSPENNRSVIMLRGPSAEESRWFYSRWFTGCKRMPFISVCDTNQCLSLQGVFAPFAR